MEAPLRGPELARVRGKDGTIRSGLFEEDNVISALQGCETSVAGSEPYSRRIIQSLPYLRVIARSEVGFDAVDVAACDEAGVAVMTTPGVNHHAVAAHTIALRANAERRPWVSGTGSQSA